MPKAVEDCVKKIKGTNKRTGKPYTQSEKWAICTAMVKKNKKASFEQEEEVVVDEEVAAEMENKMSECVRHMMETGKAKNSADARSMCEARLSKSGYDLATFELILMKEL